MMSDYIKAEQKLQEEKDKLTERLGKVLEANGIKPHRAWFNWYKNNTIVYGNCNISLKVLNDLEKEFGEIQCIYNVHNSNSLFIKFARESEE